jgi:hypothetical protein
MMEIMAANVKEVLTVGGKKEVIIAICCRKKKN